ncbi:hypothetical protein RDABS01_001067 [Bienertia sinuspersici]
MKINGEYFKLKIPSKVIDAIKDYPNHVLLDSEEFMRFNLRAKPLDPLDELKPRKIYLLVELPKFPHNNHSNSQSPIRRVRSGVLASTIATKKIYQRSFSDHHMIDARSSSGPLDYTHVVGPTRVKMRLPKAQVQRIMEKGDDNVDVAKQILQLYSDENVVV